MVKKTLFFALMLIVSKSSIAANEYNFYFYGDGDEKPVVKRAEPQNEEQNKEEEKISRELPSEEEQIQKLADEVAARIKTEPDSKGSFALRAQDDVSKPTYSFWGGPANYFSIGTTAEFYAPGSNFNSTIGSGALPYFLVRTKFISGITLEGAIPTAQYINDEFNIYRVGILKEFPLASWFFLNLSGGALFNSEGEEDNRKKRARKENSALSFLGIKELYENDIAGYVGAGLTIRLWRHWDLTSSVMAVPSQFSFNHYGGNGIHWRGDAIGSMGLTFVF